VPVHGIGPHGRGNLDAGGWMLESGCWRLDAGCWILEAGYWDLLLMIIGIGI